MTATAEVKQDSIRIQRANPDAPILYVSGRSELGIRAGTVLEIDRSSYAFEADTPVHVHDALSPGRDYGVSLDDSGKPFAALVRTGRPLDEGFFAGFHFAPGGNAAGTSGGDAVATINPYSLWDAIFRPSCADPRGMAIIETSGSKRFWADIYLLGIDHHENGTSRCAAIIADGRDLPFRPDGNGRYKKLDYATAVEIYAHHGKRLLGAEEFFSAAYGVKERCSRDEEPTITGTLDDRAERHISQRGIFDATGTMWQWGTDGHPDDPRPSLFGGSWFSGEVAGSRHALLAYWPGDSDVDIGARGACDHLNLA